MRPKLLAASEILWSRWPTVALGVGCMVLQVGCASQPRTNEPVAEPSGVGPCSPMADGRPRLIIRREYFEEASFRLVESKVTLDGNVVFASTDEERLRNKVEVVHDAPSAPGRHGVKALHRLKGYGEGAFSYLNGYRFEVPSWHVVDVQPAGGTCLSVMLYFKGDESLPLEERPANRHYEEWGARSRAAAATRTTNELEPVRSECRKLSETCVQMATQLLKTHPDIAVQVFRDACDANIASGCAELGHAYSEGGVLPQDGKRADDAYEKACRLDSLLCD